MAAGAWRRCAGGWSGARGMTRGDIDKRADAYQWWQYAMNVFGFGFYFWFGYRGNFTRGTAGGRREN